MCPNWPGSGCMDGLIEGCVPRIGHVMSPATVKDDDWYDMPTADAAEEGELGPVFVAEYESDSTCCGDRIMPGEDARADGYGGWIHADTECERLTLFKHGQTAVPDKACLTCFTIHAPHQKECS